MFQKKVGINGLGGGGIGGLKKTIIKPKSGGIASLIQKKTALTVKSAEEEDDQPENQEAKQTQDEQQLPKASEVQKDQENDEDTTKGPSGGSFGGLKKGVGGIGGLKKTIIKPKPGGMGGLM